MGLLLSLVLLGDYSRDLSNCDCLRLLRMRLCLLILEYVKVESEKFITVQLSHFSLVK